MGQGQSSANGDDAAPQTDAAVTKRDYYELLGVERTATEDELKKAYRRKALELHPDRNYGNVEEATKLFAEVQSAYEVLADPQERAWYDSHRDVLLRGDTGGQAGEEYSYNVKMTTADEVLKLMMKFNGRLEYSDAPSGFYGGLHDFFQQLAREEDIACQWEDQDPSEYPEFGTMEDDYEDTVRPFYAAWTGFATKKSYAWKDQYRLSDAPDRRIRRLMEKENKKVREEAVQEFNDAVRSLVAFVRKRDPRVRNNQKSEAERQKALRDAAAAQATRARAARQAQNEELENYVVPEWAQSGVKDEHEGGFSSESEVEEHEYDCVVCDKTFKSEAQFKAHEKSKKHVKLLKQLKRDMRAEGHELDLEGKTTTDGAEVFDEEDLVESAGGERAGRHEPEPLESLEDSDHGQSSGVEHPKKEALRTKPKVADKSSDEATESEDEDQDSDYAPRSAVESRLTSALVDDENNMDGLAAGIKDAKITSQPADANQHEDDTDSETETTPSTSTPQNEPKVGKAKQKRLKKAAAAVQASSMESGTAVGGGEFNCVVCGNDFSSKTQLFKHIKEKNHAAPLSQTKPSAGGGSKGKAGKGKKR